MDLIKEDLKIRAKEINDYLDLLNFIEDTKSLINDTGKVHKIDVTLKSTLKGMVFLLLYNLTEATMRESIAHIHEQMDQKAIEFNQLRETIRKEILKRARSEKIGIDHLLINTKSSISKQLAASTFNKKNLFSGNIDHQEVTGQAKIYGFNTDTEYDETKHGKSLKTIKEKRNDLAHGNDSFAEIGKNYATSDLNDFAREVIAYLDKITSHIADYVASQSYLT
ncbi:MAG: MAE_28990/MAE_18760 family HEPN-like nuclease [Methylomonas lenta]|nr:MAE_28990/MAE_18760 family HEPN-like nuclease [Methylomonas lenta]